MDLILLFIVFSFGLFLLSFIFILLDILKVKKEVKQGSKKKGLSKLSGYSYGFGVLALLLLMFVGAILSI